MATLTDEETAVRAEARAKEPAICAALDGEDHHRHSAETRERWTARGCD
jgi:hypothetical protein